MPTLISQRRNGVSFLHLLQKDKAERELAVEGLQAFGAGLQSAGNSVQAGAARYDSLVRPVIDARAEGFCKLIAERSRRCILGAHVPGGRDNSARCCRHDGKYAR